MEHPEQFTVNGQRIWGTKAQVEKALRGVVPETVRQHAVEIGGVRYPVKQAFAVAFGLKRSDFISHTARRMFLRLGFPVSSGPPPRQSPPVHREHERRRRPPPTPPSRPPNRAGAPASGLRPRFPRASGLPRPRRAELDEEEGRPVAQVQTLELPPIVLEWSPWMRWDHLEGDQRRGAVAQVPDAQPGVYEPMMEGKQERLVIGRTSDLRARVKQALIGGTAVHPAGDKIRENEDTSRVRIRWPVTDRPAAAEEELHRQHVRRHGKLPKYTHRT